MPGDDKSIYDVIAAIVYWLFMILVGVLFILLTSWYRLYLLFKDW